MWIIEFETARYDWNEVVIDRCLRDKIGAAKRESDFMKALSVKRYSEFALI